MFTCHNNTGWSIICVNYKFLITRARFNYRCQKICHFFTDTGTFRYLLLIFTYINFENFNIWDSLKNKKWDLTPKCLIFGYFGSKITKKFFSFRLWPSKSIFQYEGTDKNQCLVVAELLEIIFLWFLSQNIQKLGICGIQHHFMSFKESQILKFSKFIYEY